MKIPDRLEVGERLLCGELPTGEKIFVRLMEQGEGSYEIARHLPEGTAFTDMTLEDNFLTVQAAVSRAKELVKVWGGKTANLE